MNKDEIIKSAVITKQEVSDGELALINLQSLKTLTAEEVFVFKLAACNNLVDRDFERFTDAALEKLAALYVGRTMISDHSWKASLQTARIYAGSVEPMKEGEGKQLVLRAYMLSSDATKDTIAAIEGGILREVSIACRITKAVCSICGVDNREVMCQHWPGREYDGKTCHFDLDEPTDAYEVSFVAVPAQPAAGVTKAYGGNAPDPEEPGTTSEKHDTAEFDYEIRLREAEMKNLSFEMEENNE